MQVERYQALANAVQISLIIINILQLELQKTLKQVKIDLIDYTDKITLMTILMYLL